jgi:DNA end-binding protein Ku
MARFVDKTEIDPRYWEKPYYLLPDGDAGEEGYAVLRDALAETGKVAVGQLILTGREHLIGIRPMCASSCRLRSSDGRQRSKWRQRKLPQP